MMTIKVPIETDFSEIRKKFGTGCLPLESSHFGTQDINQFMFNNGPEPLSFSTKQQHSPMTNNNLQLNPALMTNFNTDIHPRGIVDTNTIPSSIGVGYRSLFGGSIPGFFPATPNLASSLHGLLPNGGSKSFFDQINNLDELTQQQPKTFQQQQQQQRTTPTTATTTTTMPTTQALSMNIHHQLQNALHNICASGIVAGNNGGWYGNMMMGATTSSTATSIMGTNNNNNNKNSTTGTMNITNVKTTNNTELD
ncbi:hypothetical protein HUG17_8251 [Dermatophagoides farinae]|uniref:Uncharacterized protein n=1 Tax=Dermatophagoides farinae TaxID=6954 RepID=A0A9D4NZC0_DERFA|nr:hypothetical protein HUG17_8251 [Dermatophagoides farinae]